MSLVVKSSKDTTGKLVSMVTTAVSLPTLPAASVAVTVSPSTRLPGFGTDQLPSVPATTVAVSFTVPVSAGVLSFVNTSSSATTGAVMSAETVPVPGNEVLPAGSVAVAVTVSPSTRLPGFGTDQLPSVPATTVAVVPSG
ncbi:Uncharacterised protein [Acinetobacter baumannii]|nr:Uncharacterised protein [Acinetobacter baumannii]